MMRTRRSSSSATSLKQRAYNHLRDGMLSGRIRPGTRLSEVALSESIGISRTPLREAIHQLESEGLVEQMPRFGAFVRVLERQDLLELYDLRQLMETHAAARAAQRITDAELEEMRAHLQTMKKAAHALRDRDWNTADEQAIGRFVIADLAFHLVLIRAAGNRRLMKLIADAGMLTQIFGYQRDNPAVPLVKHLAQVYRGHAEILRALSKHDAKGACDWLRRHIEHAREKAMARCDAQEQAQRDADLMPARAVRELVDRMQRGELRSELERRS